MAHCAAIGLNTCPQLLNRKKPTEEIDSIEMEKVLKDISYLYKSKP